MKKLFKLLVLGGIGFAVYYFVQQRKEEEQEWQELDS